MGQKLFLGPNAKEEKRGRSRLENGRKNWRLGAVAQYMHFFAYVAVLALPLLLAYPAFRDCFQNVSRRGVFRSLEAPSRGEAWLMVPLRPSAVSAAQICNCISLFSALHDVCFALVCKACQVC